ncbi:MAG: ribonuclease III [Bacillota bacterium]|nr:ribonuclease III [Bacillota bacterium]
MSRATGPPDALREWQQKVGLSDVEPGLLRQAFVHRSYAHELDEGPDNERLEFLGDAVLGLVISEQLYRRHPECREGELTRRKAFLVSRRTLAAIAARLEIGPLLQLGHGEEATGGRERASVLGNALEALIGCLYLHGGYRRAEAFVLQNWQVELEALGARGSTDAKSELQEKTQAWYGQRPTYVLVKAEGPDHAKRFAVQVVLDSLILGEGVGYTKKEAQQTAAREALGRLSSPSAHSGELRR